MTTSDKIKALLDQHHAQTPEGYYPLIFNGLSGPRFIGYAAGYLHADEIMLCAGLSAAKLSTATLDGDARKFIVAH